MKSYEVKLCYTGYLTVLVQAVNKTHAIKLAEKVVHENIVLENIERWKAADTVKDTSG